LPSFVADACVQECRTDMPDESKDEEAQKAVQGLALLRSAGVFLNEKSDRTNISERSMKKEQNCKKQKSSSDVRIKTENDHHESKTKEVIITGAPQHSNPLKKPLDILVNRRRNSVWTQIKSPPPPPFPAPSINSRSISDKESFVPIRIKQQRPSFANSQRRQQYSYPSYTPSTSPPPSYPPPKFARRSVPTDRLFPVHTAADDPYLPPHVLYQRPAYLGPSAAHFRNRENHARKFSFSNFPPQQPGSNVHSSRPVPYLHQKPTMPMKRKANQPAKRWLHQIHENEQRSKALKGNPAQRRRTKSYPVSGNLNRNSMGLMNEKAMKAVQASLVKLEQASRMRREQGNDPLHHAKAQAKAAPNNRFVDAKTATRFNLMMKNFANFKVF